MIIVLAVYLAIGFVLAYDINRTMLDRAEARSLAVLFTITIFWLPGLCVAGPVALRTIREDARTTERVRKIRARAALRSFGAVKRAARDARRRWCAVRTIDACSRRRRVLRYMRPYRRSPLRSFLLRLIEGRA